MCSSLPRLHFSGSFQTDPSTVNNDVAHYDTASFRSSYQLPRKDRHDLNGWWNPKGSSAFRFNDCTITGAVNAAGLHVDSDPVVGVPLHDALAAPPAKLVDLDPLQQLVSTIWGMRVSVGGPSGIGFVGDFEPAAFSDLWKRCAADGGGPPYLGSAWESKVTINGSVQAGDSAVLKEFAQYKELRLRFVVDGYSADSTDPLFTFGRVVGTFTPLVSGGPRQATWVRRLRAEDNSVNTAYAEVVSTSTGHSLVSVDLGNSLQTSAIGGNLNDIGDLRLAYRPTPTDPITVIGSSIPYTQRGWYTKTAGVFTTVVSAAEATVLKGVPLMLVSVSSSSRKIKSDTNSTYKTLLAENKDGVHVWADTYVFRIETDGVAKATIWATKFGAPSDEAVYFVQDSTVMKNQQINKAPPNAGVPNTVLKFKPSITTGPKGSATIAIGASDPGNPRGFIDGQVYGIAYAAGAPPKVGSIQNPSDILSFLVFDKYTEVTNPTWVGHIQPILVQYANLYPVMRPMVDLASYSSIMSRLQAVDLAFRLDINNANYMPVTRDMSAPKRKTIQNWLGSSSPPTYMNPNSEQELKTVIQWAIELEHATIPVYLAALYSIKPGRNVEIAATIRSVVMEEMLHLAFMCNLLLSIGGSPQIGTPGFIPSYPGPLPGGVGVGLIARLRKCSIEQIRDVFMAIETPGELAIVSNGESIPTAPAVKTPYTIGWFYDQVEAALTAQQDTLNFGQNMDKQADNWKFSNSPESTLFKIGSYADAVKAIEIIKDQGEGNGANNPTDDGKELSHYYKFAEIVAGRELVLCGTTTKDGKVINQYSYTGSAIPFEEDGVYDIIDDPVLVDFNQGSRARILTKVFSDTYQTMLNNLHIAFNGDPQTLDHAVGMMYTLSAQARQLMQTPSGRNDGTFAGVSFQPPVDSFGPPRPDQVPDGDAPLHVMKSMV